MAFAVSLKGRSGGIYPARFPLRALLCTNLPCAAFEIPKPLIPLPLSAEVAASGMMADALDLDAHAGCLGNGGQFLHPDARYTHPLVLQAGTGDPLGQALDEVQMSLGDDGSDAFHHGCIADDVVEAVAMHGFRDGEVDIDADRLGAALFVLVDADMRVEQEVAHEDVADGPFSIRDLQGVYVFWLAHAESSTPKCRSRPAFPRRGAGRRRAQSSARSWRARRE